VGRASLNNVVSEIEVGGIDWLELMEKARDMDESGCNPFVDVDSGVVTARQGWAREIHRLRA